MASYHSATQKPGDARGGVIDGLHGLRTGEGLYEALEEVTKLRDGHIFQRTRLLVGDLGPEGLGLLADVVGETEQDTVDLK